MCIGTGISESNVGDRHGWNTWQEYQNAHYGFLDRYTHFILSDKVSYTIATSSVVWSGKLHCAGGIEISVHKVQEIDESTGTLYVRTAHYSYHVLRRARGQVVDLFRYDNSPHYDYPDAHHRHWFDADGTEYVEHVGEDRWPTLGEVVQETEALLYDTLA